MPLEAMAERTLDAERMFAVLAEHRVDYVVVGGVAVQVHGHVRMTNDLDLIPAPNRANLDRLATALRELNARVLNPGSEDLEIDASMLRRATLWQLSTEVGDSISCTTPLEPPHSRNCGLEP
jgi:hypothetical protein